MKKCPTCNRDADVLITNVRDGSQFCHQCAAQVCPTFLPHYVLTVEDILFFKACGIDPQIPDVLAELVNRVLSQRREGV